jgi:lipoate---protein ligase
MLGQGVCVTVSAWTRRRMPPGGPLGGAMDLVVDGLERDGPALLALDEALVRAGPSRPTLRLWVNPPAAVIGRFQDVAREVALEACAADGVAVLRRASGGGTVYHDLGNLNVALVLPGRRTDGLDSLAALLLRRLHGLGLPVERRSRGLFVGPAKVVGFASLQTRPGTLAHASVLVTTEAAAVDRYLAPARVPPGPRDSHRVPVASLRSLGVDVTVPELAAILRAQMDGGVTARGPTPAEWAAHDRLLASRYRDPGWHLTGTRSSPTGPTKEEAWTTACG